MSEALAAFLDRSAADLTETARTAAAQALLSLGGEYAEAAAGLPEDADALRVALGRLGGRMDQTAMRWLDGHTGGEEWQRPRRALKSAWFIAANAETWAGRADAPVKLISDWAGLAGIADEQ